MKDAGLLNCPSATPNVITNNRNIIERQKTRDLVRQANEAFRAEARSELLRETIAKAIADLPAINITPERIVADPEQEAMVVCLGDFHYGAKIDVKGLKGETLNHFDSEVFEQQRMCQLLRDIERVADANPAISKIYIFMVGDLVDGMLRQSQLMRLEYGIVESTMRLSEYLSTWIANIVNMTKLPVEVVACSGNHSEIRPLNAKSREYEDENIEKIILWYLSERLKDCCVVRTDVRRMALVDVCGYSFLLLHGDGKEVTQAASDAVNLYQQPVDFFVCGHKHRENEYPAGATNDGHSVIIRVPSICGVDNYAQS